LQLPRLHIYLGELGKCQFDPLTTFSSRNTPCKRRLASRLEEVAVMMLDPLQARSRNPKAFHTSGILMV
jgi:hypothetical protein